MAQRPLACLILIRSLPFLFLIGCGPCDDFKSVPLTSIPADMRQADRLLFSKRFAADWGFNVSLKELARHPVSARAFLDLRYVERDGTTLRMTKTGFANSSNWSYNDEAFFMIGHSIASPFRSAQEGHICDETHTYHRIYPFRQTVTRLTALGMRLYTSGQLIRVEEFSAVRRPWRGLHETLAGTADVFLSPRASNSITIGGELISLPWNHQ